VRSPLFNVLTCALLHPPPESRRAMRVAATWIGPWTNPTAAAGAVADSRTWIDVMLQPHAQPPRGTLFVALPREYGRWDVVRTEYTAGALRIHVAQARHLMTVRLCGARTGRGEPPLVLAEELARVIFNMPERIELRPVGRFRGGDYGEQDPAGPPALAPDGTHWHDVLSWWVSRDDVAFVRSRMKAECRASCRCRTSLRTASGSTRGSR
jgi:hypothetical protein